VSGPALANKISYLIELTYNQHGDKIVDTLWQLLRIDSEQETIDSQPSAIIYQPQATNEVGEKSLWN
jgi:hypothetical protein